jgi:hypothetical protein
MDPGTMMKRLNDLESENRRLRAAVKFACNEMEKILFRKASGKWLTDAVVPDGTCSYWTDWVARMRKAWR